MRRIRNISAETQIWIDTLIPDIGEIDVASGAVFPCTDDQWVYYVENYNKLFETVFNPWWASWEANFWNNLWAWEWVYSTKTWVTLNFKSLIAGSWISISSNADEITITNTNSSWILPETLPITIDGQVDFTLTNPIIAPWSNTRVYVNWQKAIYGSDYIFTTTINLRWSNTSYTLETTDVLEIYYL